MKQAIVVFDSGSTSLKFGTYLVDSAVDPAAALSQLRVGRIGSMQGDPHFVVKDGVGKPLDTHEWGDGPAIDHTDALKYAISWLEAHLGRTKILPAPTTACRSGSSPLTRN